MYRTDANGNVGNLFDDGDPLVPRVATQVDAAWLNEVQQELCYFVETAGLTLVKGTRTQLWNAFLNALATLFSNLVQGSLNTPAIKVTGQGTGAGIEATGGASGPDVNLISGNTVRGAIALGTKASVSAPVNGDLWFDGSALKIRIGGVTKTVTVT